MKLFVLLVTMCIYSAAWPQQKNGRDTTQFIYIEHMPIPKVDVQQYIQHNLVYPEDAKRKQIEGKVAVKFIVTKTGKVVGATVVKKCYPSLDSEALRLVKNMPDWKPGENDGKQVDVFYTLPVVFKLPSSK
jgi:TonB family protein